MRPKSPVIGIIFLYFLAFFLLPLNSGIFWDDWTLVGVTPQSIHAEFFDYGIPQQGYLLSFLASIPGGIVLSRVLVFIFFLLAALLLYKILRTIDIIQSEACFFIALIFAVFPVNFARISLATFPYAFCLFLFFVAWWLISKYLTDKKIIYRILALILLFLSFSLNSLLVYYLLILFYIAYIYRSKITSWRSGLSLIIHHIDLVILPVFYWIIQKVFFPPRDLYQEYNKITLSNLSHLPGQILVAFKTSFFEPILQSFSHLTLILVILSLIAGLGYFFWQRQKSFSPPKKVKFDLILFFLGILLFIIGIFPYLAAGHAPTLYEWSSRHQLLVPLGAGFIIYYFFSILFTIIHQIKWRGPLLLMLCCLFIGLNVSIYLKFQQDWFKQQSIISHLESSDQIRNSTTILFTDTTVGWNAINRTYRFYEYTGMMRKAYQTETRLGDNRDVFQSVDSYLPSTKSDRYNISSYQPHKPQYLVTIVPGDLTMSSGETFQLLWLESFNHQEFQKKIPRIISLEFQQMY